MRPELNPCPFCGGDDLTIVRCDGYFVGCYTCKACGPQGITVEEAVRYWNRHVGDDQMERMVDDGK